MGCSHAKKTQSIQVNNSTTLKPTYFKGDTAKYVQYIIDHKDKHTGKNLVILLRNLELNGLSYYLKRPFSNKYVPSSLTL